ncbi:FAD-binding oxidoreductase [Acidomonas methanolica]|nr:FAD-binding oxidoreductase [Acidomonas methanolica]MCQ9155736.1 FAD-binding oxidoreductase [Acidomonas methanolica]
MPPSIYAARGPEEPLPLLTRNVTADVVVIGGGLTGLSTALHLAEAGRAVIVLDAEEPGWGASGRNGGQVNPGLKNDPDTVLEDFGPEYGPRLVEMAWSAPDAVFDLIARHGIACDAARGGTIRAATAKGQLPALRALYAQSRARGWPVTWLDPDDMTARTGASSYCGGLVDARGGQLDPLAYTRGLARAAAAQGARLFGRSRARAVRRRGGSWRVETERGSVTAPAVLLATNGYSGRLWNDLRRSIVPVYSAIVASAPLPDALRARLLAGREVVYDLGRITTYYRVDADGRLLMGGRSRSADAAGSTAFPALVAHALKLWPDLALEPEPVRWTHGWNGQIAMTADHYPHWHAPQPGVYAALGYNGRGVAMATVTGREMARFLTGEAPPLFPFTPARPIPFHSAWKAGVAARILCGRLGDGWAR